MNYGSVCSGIEAATVAWHPLGWKPVFFSEIDKNASAVLGHHYPEVPNLGDMTKFREWPDAVIDVIVGGTPCQSFSVAGLRKGMADPRGNLALTYLAIADRYRPRWLVWENVPGVLSSNGGRDFGAILGGMVELGYGIAYRVLDAQFVRVDGIGRAVPQRRRRVFVVGCLGDWRRAAAVLFERESMFWDTPPRREAGQGSAGGATGRAGERSHWDGVEHPHPTPNQSHNTGGVGASNQELFSQRGAYLVGEQTAALMVAFGEYADDGTASTLKQRDYKDAADLISVTHTLRGEGFDASDDGTGRGTPLVPVAFSAKDHGADATEDLSPTLRAMPHDASHANGGGQMAVAVSLRGRDGGGTAELGDDVGNCLRASQGGGDKPHVLAHMAVRRLTPVECARLQGFPDDYLNCLKSDGPRYKALGNSMAVNVMRWIGTRIQMVEDAMKDDAA